MEDSDNFFEILLVCENSTQPWPITFYNPLTGASIWSYKGSELNNDPPQDVALVANEYLLVPVGRKPLTVLVGLESKNRTMQKSYLSAPLNCVAVSSDGSICCGSTNEHMYIWMLTTGKLISSVATHYQAITRIVFSTDDFYVVTAGKDGLIFVWNVGDLLTPQNSLAASKIAPIHEWSAHSLAVADVKVGFGGISARVYSASLDQTAKIHCLVTGTLLMTLFFDCPLTSCAVDNAESRIYVGTSKGDIRQIDLFVEPVLRERHVDLSLDRDEKMFKGHSQSVTSLAVNIDGTLLASSSDDSEVKVWHVRSRQCIRTINCKGIPRKVQFYPKITALFQADYVPQTPVQPLSKILATSVDGEVLVYLGKSKTSAHSSNRFALANIDRLMDDLVDEERLTELKLSQLEEGDRDLTYDAEYLRRELAKTKLINKRLYDFCIDNVLK